jgi:hypothetical protein
MGQRNEQRVCQKCCASLGKSATENLTMNQQVFGHQILSRKQVFEWHSRFRTGRTSVDGDENTGRLEIYTTPETCKNARARTLGWSQTIHDIAEEVGIGNETWQLVLTKEIARTDLAASPWQHLVPHFNSHPAVSGETQMALYPTHRNLLIWNPVKSSYFQKWNFKLERRRFDIMEVIQAECQRMLDTLTEKDFQEAFQKLRR